MSSTRSNQETRHSTPETTKATPARRRSSATLGAFRRPWSGPEGLRILQEVEMELTVELGRARVPLRDLLDLAPGSVIELDRAAGAEVDVLVNGTLLAKGEVVVVDDEFGVRITEVIGADEIAEEA